ncbi:hypothetical protein J2S66_004028 [Saccharothrix longispora]|uniref:HicA-like toxin of HicAB toxin-antitoxin system n=1 Tax=Saccharothrix longispora TaxID=33920 RepID=A0ABU1PZQ3_9PSEU|nr:hypothetical protein [Saccharothrix longispora]
MERATLRFTTAEQVDALLAQSGFEVVGRHGSWDRAPLTATSREIITVARPAPGVSDHGGAVAVAFGTRVGVRDSKNPRGDAPGFPTSS